MTSPVTFVAGKPIWPAGFHTEMNITVGFRATVDLPPGGAVLRMTGSSICRVFLNGQFAGYGPARGPEEFYRVDHWPLRASGRCTVAIEVAGYNVNSFYLLDQPPFLQAEIVAGDRVLASTAGAGAPFEAAVLPQRVQKVARFSYQRPFFEVYRMTPDADAWRTGGAPFAGVRCDVLEPRALLPRGVPYPAFAMRAPVWHVSAGTLAASPREKLWRDWSLAKVDDGALKGFTEGQQERTPWIELQHLATTLRPVDKPLRAGETFTLAANHAEILSFGGNLTGFLGCSVKCERPSRLILSFDEVLSASGDVDHTRASCQNLVEYALQPGTYQLEAFEPQTMQYVKIQVLEGQCEVGGVYLRLYDNPDADRAHFACSDAALNEIFEAGRETFRQNAVDAFTDCPSRERAGWLCDSFFTGRVAADLCGNTSVEHVFFENFLLPPKFADIEEGMLPMLYPGNSRDGCFIPQWALFFVLQLEEYLHRSGDRAMVEALRPRVLALLEWFARHRNADGLLEKMPKWNFIEWSKAGDFVQDVHYPTNMLYSGVLDATARMYNLPALAAQAADVRGKVLAASFDGEWFVDNAVYQDGRLTVTRNRSEVCQYFAFFFGLAAPHSHPDLWRRLTTEFGPERKAKGLLPEIHYADAFIGNYVRLEVLSRYGRREQVLAEINGYFLNMARATRTLWEHDSPSASCNHGFASHVCHSACRDVLGVRSIDAITRTIEIGLADLPMDWCYGRIPMGENYLCMEWWRKDGGLHYRVNAPADWRVTMAADSATATPHA